MELSSKLKVLAVISAFAACQGAVQAKEADQASLKAQAKIPEATARATALAKVSHGKIASSELEEENGKLIWSFDISKKGTRNITEIQVDAKTGVIVSKTVESPGKEAKEAVDEAKEAKKN